VLDELLSLAVAGLLFGWRSTVAVVVGIGAAFALYRSRPPDSTAWWVLAAIVVLSYAIVFSWELAAARRKRQAST